MNRRPPRSTRTYPPFPYPTLFRSAATAVASAPAGPAAGLAAPVNPQTDAARAWNYADSDLPVDPNVIFGVLPNGMKYALLHNGRSEEHTSELQSLTRISYAVFCLKKKTNKVKVTSATQTHRT